MFNEYGSVNEACTRARAIYGLEAVTTNGSTRTEVNNVIHHHLE